jgi:phosphoribosylformylglycinamidine (FGAM) synthase-like enzyme
VSDGGLAPVLAECAVVGPAGPSALDVRLPRSAGDRVDQLLFGEAPARFVVSYSTERADEVERLRAARRALHRDRPGRRRSPSHHPRGRRAVLARGKPIELELERLVRAWRDGLRVALG